VCRIKGLTKGRADAESTSRTMREDVMDAVAAGSSISGQWEEWSRVLSFDKVRGGPAQWNARLRQEQCLG
jgi:hypothetical protein